MSELCRLGAIKIFMYPNDHGPPHFHAESRGSAIVVLIDDLLIERGRLSIRQQRVVLEWARTHQAELRRAWRQASAGIHPDRIE